MKLFKKYLLKKTNQLPTSLRVNATIKSRESSVRPQENIFPSCVSNLFLRGIKNKVENGNK